MLRFGSSDSSVARQRKILRCFRIFGGAYFPRMCQSLRAQPTREM